MGKLRAVVVGGGIVGLHFARLAADAGIEVVLYESKKRVSDNAEKASGILSIRGLDRIGIDYDGAVVNTLRGAVLHSNGKTLNVMSQKPMAYVLDRKILAENAERSAKSAGAEIVNGKRLQKNDLVELAHDRSTVLVGADGAVSGVAKTFGFPPIDDYVLTYKSEYGNAPVENDGAVGLYFSKRYAQGLFGWHVPYSNGLVEIGLGISPSSRIDSRSAFRRFIGSGDLDEMIEGARMISGHASIIPLAPRRRTVIGNVALVGDAAGQVKATTGGGIVFGCLSAKLLCDSIVKSDGKARNVARYERMWRAAHGMDLSMHRIIHSYYSGARNLGRTFGMVQALGLEDFFSRYGDMDSPGLMIKRFLIRGLSE